MKQPYPPNLGENAPNLGVALGLGADSFGEFLKERDDVLAQRKAEHDEQLCSSYREALAWAE